MRLKELRVNANLTQQEISKILNVDQSNYSKYEKGQVEPNIQTLINLANYYKVTIDYLLGRDFGNELGYLTQEQFENFKLIMKLNEINQYKVFGYATSLLENQ